MTLVAAAVVPAAPALLPGLGGAADPLSALREVCRCAVGEGVSAPGPEAQVVVVAGWEHGDTGGTARRPVRRDWPLNAPSGAARFTTGRVPRGALPTGLEIGRLMLGECDATLVSVAWDAAPGECLALGQRLVADGPTVLVVVADGSAKRTVKAPGHLDERSEGFDAELSRALAAADADALAALDPVLADELWCQGRAALQVLAGAASDRLTGTVRYDDAPFGVGYVVAAWT